MAEPAPRPPDVPRFVEYSPTHLRGYLLGGVFVVAAVAAVITLFVAVSDNSSAALVVAGGCIVLALIAWWALLGWKPTVVTIEEGALEVTRGGHTERFELTEPSTSVTFAGRPGSPSWAATIRNDNGPRTVLRSSHVSRASSNASCGTTAARAGHQTIVDTAPAGTGAPMWLLPASTTSCRSVCPLL